MSGLLNIGSLLFGIVAWVLPVVSLVRQPKSGRSWAVFSAASAGACAVSLCLQIYELNHRVNIQDWAALLDTSAAVALVATVLLIVTIILNVISLAVHYGKQPRD
ncbi:cytochrome c oxidase subunit 4 [Sporobacter termitidis DSM 10068]|uniref:Cytochrome c oxidase subunit 4 n=1 Tax=Sporobacter termitidis DSM 10068 TaxID=1123282 RepID=A0A1M5T9T0_9FIRM|nr:hypothetical protein [Sporobacter termitidis]SHH47472.1 cytochrome c oxidase subunit 4 [Sporobacter termitidis DSM 10068]